MMVDTSNYLGASFLNSPKIEANGRTQHRQYSGTIPHLIDANEKTHDADNDKYYSILTYTTVEDTVIWLPGNRAIIGVYANIPPIVKIPPEHC